MPTPAMHDTPPLTAAGARTLGRLAGREREQLTRIMRKLLAHLDECGRTYFATATRSAFTKAPWERTSSASAAESFSLLSCLVPAGWSGPVRLTR
jgi:hypothetical protein